jgi:3-hydroxyisobutyrate dehydrogenase-like beta-hydroxyacid dehydrogenase
MMKVGSVGYGEMGGPMADHLQSVKFGAVVFDIRPAVTKAIALL